MLKLESKKFLTKVRSLTQRRWRVFGSSFGKGERHSKGEFADMIRKQNINWSKKAKVNWAKDRDCESTFFHRWLAAGEIRIV